MSVESSVSHYAKIQLVLLCIAFAIWIVLSFTQKRTKKLKRCCFGRPGLVPPVNFLSPRHRLVYTLACAAQTSLWLSLLFVSYQLHVDTNKWLSLAVKALILLVLTGYAVLLTYPILACVDTPVPILGYTLGLLYSCLYLGTRLYGQYSIFPDNLSGASTSYRSFIIGRTTAVVLPESVCMVLVIIWYLYKWIKEILRLVKTKQFNETRLFESHHYIYVKKLLKRDQSQWWVRGLGGAIYLHKNVSLPLPVLIAASVSTTAMFQLLVACISTFPYLSEQLAATVENQGNSDILGVVVDFIHSVTVVIVIALVLSTILILSLLLHLIHTIRKETLLIRRGKSDLTKTIRNVKWPSIKLMYSVRYCGYQIASILTGWMFYSIVFFFVGSFLLGFHILPEFFGYILYFFGMTILIVVSAIVIEGLMCKFIFLSSESNEEKTIMVNNRRAFNTFYYCILLYNVATGLFTSTIRIIVAFLLALLVKPRLDRIVFISPFQLFDSGHSMYKSFMIAEALFHNPVVNVFIQLISQKSVANNDYTNKDSNGQGYRFSQRAKNRWLVAYTLLKNRSLVPRVPRAGPLAKTGTEYTDNEDSSTVHYRGHAHHPPPVYIDDNPFYPSPAIAPGGEEGIYKKIGMDNYYTVDDDDQELIQY